MIDWRSALRESALRHGTLTQVNPMWVAFQHRDTEKLVSRRNWVNRWRADKLGNSTVRATRKELQSYTKVI